MFLLAVFPAAWTLRPKIDEDTWWHLRVGQDIVRTHALPNTDSYSRIGIEEQREWIAYSWLYEVALWESYHLGGLVGVMLFRSMLAGAAYLIVVTFLLRFGSNLIVLVFLTIAWLPLMTERPWHITIMGTVATLWVIENVRSGRRSRWDFVLPLIYIVWANTHIQFVVGLGILTLATLIHRDQRMLYLTLLCFLATIVNPYHVRLWGIVVEYATQSAPLELVSELCPPSPWKWWNLAMFTLQLWALIVLIRRRTTWDIALFVVGLLFSLRMQRDLWFGVLTSSLVILRYYGSSPSPRLCGERAGVRGSSDNDCEMEDKTPLTPTLSPQSRGEGVGVIVLAFVLIRGLTLFNAQLSQEKFYPVAAVEFVRHHEIPGPLFNDFNWGGYLIFALPEHPVSIDGRTNLYGSERLRRSVNTWTSADGWATDPDVLASRMVIANREFELTRRLREDDQRWEVIYTDDIAVVFRLRAGVRLAHDRFDGN